MFSLVRKLSGSALLVILAFAYLTRMFNVYTPTGYMFDEVYHAVTAKLIAHNDPRAFEWWAQPPEPQTAVDWLHPPLAKYTQALSMLAFGENSFGWRFSSVIFGTLVIMMIYHLAKALFEDEKLAVLAAAIASLDGLLLVQSRIAMNDIHVTFFILLTLYWYVRFRKSYQPWQLLLTGLSAGLAVATKWSGVYILATVFFLEALRFVTILVSAKGKILSKKYSFKKLVTDVFLWLFALVILPCLVYLSAYGMMFAQGKSWKHFWELHKQIWYYQTHLSATHPYQSVPWQWLLNVKPVWYYVEYLDSKRADIYASGNSVIFWTGLVAVLSSLGLVLKNIFHKKKNWLTNGLHYLNQSEHVKVLIPYIFVWLPWSFSPRIMFFYHYTPAVPFLCIILAYWLKRLYVHSALGEKVFWLVMVLMLLYFIVWYPHWVALPMSTAFKDAVYFKFAK
jgi:dolichyl-phosphate-mannose--protein O-mannosyl transferase